MRPAAIAPLAFLALGPGPRAAAQTVDQVIARYVEARGGLAKVRGVSTLRLTGRMTLPGVEAPLVLELKRPNRMRTEFVFQGNTGVRAFDGQTAWHVLPLPGQEARKMPPDEAREAAQLADIDLSPLIDHAAKGYAVELLGRESGLGREGGLGGEAFKLVVRSRDGQVRVLYLDTKSYLVTRIEEVRALEGMDEEFVTVVGDYRSVSGVVFPHAIEVAPRRGADAAQKLVFDRIEVNVPIDDGRFAMPVATAPRS